MTKWLVILITSLTLAQTSRTIDEVQKFYNELENKKVVRITTEQFKSKFNAFLAFLLVAPLNAQIIVTTDQSFGSATDRVPPSVPSNLTLTVISKDTIKLNWTDPPEGDLAKIQVRKDNTLIDSVNPGVQQYYASGLTFNTHYYFDLRARDDSSNWSAYCDTVGANTKDTVTVTVPGVPLNFMVTDSTDGIDLSWTANLPLATNYVIKRDGANYDTTVSVTWTDSDTVDGVYHTYAVYGYNGSGNGTATSTLTAERVSSNTYYVSSGGSNSNSGTNPNLAWATISKVNASWLEGKNVYFKKGETFSGNLIISNNNVLLASYGSGDKPIIQTYDSIPNWATGTWTETSTNIWRLSLNSSLQVSRLWLNNVEVKRADPYDATTYGEELSADYPFKHDGSYLYVYSADNPQTSFYSMKYYSRIGTYFTVEITDQDYITIDGLEIRGGMYASLGMGGNDYAIIRNSDIGKYTNRAGIMCNGYFNPSSDLSSDYVTIKNTTINSQWVYPYVYYDGLTPYGIYAGTSGTSYTQKARYWTIDSCTIANWSFGVYLSGLYNNQSIYNIVSNSEIYNGDFSLGKGIQCYSWSASSGDTTGMMTYNSFYNNYIHDLGGSGITLASNGNYVYYNIIDSVYLGANSHITAYPSTTAGNGGYGIELITERLETLKKNYIFNNTFYKTYYQTLQWGDENYFYNNLFAEPYTKTAETGYAVAFYSTGTSSHYRSNLIFKTDDNNTAYVGEIPASTFKTITTLNALTNAGNNIYPSQTIAQIINRWTWTLPSDSKALSSESTTFNISGIIGSSTTDRWGNAVDEANPNIGAWNGTP